MTARVRVLRIRGTTLRFHRLHTPLFVSGGGVDLMLISKLVSKLIEFEAIPRDSVPSIYWEDHYTGSWCLKLHSELFGAVEIGTEIPNLDVDDETILKALESAAHELVDARNSFGHGTRP